MADPVQHLDDFRASLERLERVCQRTHFALLDLVPNEERSACSWEVEREDFMRRQGERLA